MLLVGKPEGKEQLGPPKSGWVSNNKIDLGLFGVVCTGLIWLWIGISGGLL
jgi:hypothetical protein